MENYKKLELFNSSFFPIQISKFKNYKDVKYETIPVSNEFADDIYYIWRLRSVGAVEHFSYYILPDASIDLIFENHGGTLINPIISNPFTNVFELKMCDEFDFIGIKFKPGKFRKYYDLELNEILDLFISADQLAKEYGSVDHLLKQLSKNKFRNPLEKYDENFLNLFSTNLSDRQKRRVFQRTTGFSFREYKSILKFQKVIRRPDDLYLEYYDQPHFIKQFKVLTSFTPSQFYNLFEI